MRHLSKRAYPVGVAGMRALWLSARAPGAASARDPAPPRLAQVVPAILYFSYMAIVSYSFFCLTGAIGFYACYIFVRKIYSAVKID